MIIRYGGRIIATFGVLWTLIESLGYFYEDGLGKIIKSWNEGGGFLILIFLSILIGTIWTFGKSILKYLKELIYGRSPTRILVVRSRPLWLKEKLGHTEDVIQHPNPSITEHKPEHVTLVKSDGQIINEEFENANQNFYLKTIEGTQATKENVSTALVENWDIVHFDCVIASPEAELCLEDGFVKPQALREILKDKQIKLLVLMDCDSYQIAKSALSVGVKTLIAITQSINVKAAEKFCIGFYKELSQGKTTIRSFEVGKQLASVELYRHLADKLFVLDGDSEVEFNNLKKE